MTKPVEPNEDSDLAMHLLCMCPIKCQKQYDLNVHSTPLNTKTLLLVLENIKTKVEGDEKPPSNNKAKGAELKRKIKLIDARILKKNSQGADPLDQNPLQPLKEAWEHTHHAQQVQLQPIQCQWNTQEVQ